MARPEKREIVWHAMGRLQEVGLGRREIVSDQRDKFVLATGHLAAARLTSLPDADGFIRADKGSLLLRHASAALKSAVPRAIRARAMQSTKGLEFRWTQLENDDLRTLMATIERVAVDDFTARRSQRWLQIAIERKPEVLDLALRNALTLPSNVQIEWVSPRREDGFKEYRDMEALRLVRAPDLSTRRLSDFWPPRGPVWDALGRTTDGQLLFVEAKAHIAEMASPGMKASDVSRNQIERSLEEARRHYAPQSTASWSDTFYQYANRLASHYLLRHLNRLPAHLVFIYFVNAPDVPVPASEAEWRRAIQLIHAALGLPPTRIDPHVHEIFVDTVPLVAAVANQL